MRILYLGESLQIHDFRFIEKLVEKEYDTHVVTFTDKPIKLKGATYHNFPMYEDPMSHSRFVGDIIYIKNLVRQRSFIQKLIDELKPDILHAGWIPSHGLMAAISGFHPFLLMPWGSDVLVIPQNASYLTKKQIAWTIKKADMITCDAEYVKNEIMRLSGYPENKIIVFPWGIDLEKFNPKVNGNKIRAKLGWEDKKILIMTRSFQKIYGIEYFLKTLPKLIKKNDNVRVLLCGDGPLKNDFEKYIHSKKLSKYVHLAGRIENDDLPKYLAASDVYVSTSLSDGTSVSLLEAMAVGLPCIVTDLPAIREWITDGHNGFLVPKKDSYAVYEKLDLLLNNDGLREEFGERNLIIAQHRADWNKNFTKLEKIYAKLSTNC